MNLIIKIISVTLAYYLFGKLGSFFSIPPHAATVIWPASGLALAVLLVFGFRLWPGILLGALIFNFHHSTDISLQSLLLALAIATGSLLSALLGACLCKKYVRFPNALVETSDLLKILFYGGIIACVISATVGTSSLYLAGLLESDQFTQHWFIWWVGDFLGVISFAPLVMLVLTKADEKTSVSFHRKWVVCLSFFVVFAAVSTLFFLAKKYEERDRRAIFQQNVDDVSFEFEQQLLNYYGILIANERFMLSSDLVSSKDFEIFNKKFFEVYSGIHALGWNPLVNHEDKKTFETFIEQQGFENYEIHDLIAGKRQAITEPRDRYFPVAYVEPFPKLNPLMGFDIYGGDPNDDNLRLKSLNRAMATGKTVSTGRIYILPSRDKYGILIYHPVFENNNLNKLKGFVAQVLSLPM